MFFCVKASRSAKTYNQSVIHFSTFITTNNRTTCFDWSFSHFQVLNMLQVSGSCAHIWDLKSVYI